MTVLIVSCSDQLFKLQINSMQYYPQQRVNAFQRISHFSFQLNHGCWKDFFQRGQPW